MLCLPNNLRSATTKPPARVSSPRRANRAPGTRARPGRRSDRASPINRSVLNLIERVVVGGNTRIVNLFETNDDRVSHAGLVDGDDLTIIVEPVRLRAQNLNLRGGYESASKPQSSRSVTRSMDETSRTRARASHTRRETATRERLSVGWRARRRVSSSSQWVMTPRRVPRPRPLASRARAHLGASRRADLFLGRRLRLRRRLLSRIKNTHPSSVTAPNPTARRVDAHRHRSSIHRVSNESSNHRRRTSSASARTTVRDARVVFVALRNGRNKTSSISRSRHRTASSVARASRSTDPTSRSRSREGPDRYARARRLWEKYARGRTRERRGELTTHLTANTARVDIVCASMARGRRVVRTRARARGRRARDRGDRREVDARVDFDRWCVLLCIRCTVVVWWCFCLFVVCFQSMVLVGVLGFGS